MVCWLTYKLTVFLLLQGVSCLSNHVGVERNLERENVMAKKDKFTLAIEASERSIAASEKAYMQVIAENKLKSQNEIKAYKEHTERKIKENEETFKEIARKLDRLDQKLDKFKHKLVVFLYAQFTILIGIGAMFGAAVWEIGTTLGWW
jgi:septal ring factor EnvC (AmiA/AmiB activator)